MEKTIITKNAKETQEIGERLAKKMIGGGVVCLSGDLGAGKTTFTQGFLKGLGAEGLYTSPTFLVIKHYKKEILNSKSEILNKSKAQNRELKTFDIYHIDAYRVNSKDVLALGWEEMISNSDNVIIIEWAERIKEIIPKDAMWIKFKWLDNEKREITFDN